MKYKLLVLDLDGTLTNKKKEVTEHKRRTLIEAQKRGVKIVDVYKRQTVFLFIKQILYSIKSLSVNHCCPL